MKTLFFDSQHSVFLFVDHDAILKYSTSTRYLNGYDTIREPQPQMAFLLSLLFHQVMQKALFVSNSRHIISLCTAMIRIGRLIYAWWP